MPIATAKSKLIKSKCFTQAYQSVTAADEVTNAWANILFDDDVRIVGATVSIEALITDTHSNADGLVNAVVEISRSGVHSGADVIVYCELMKVWNAAISIGGGGNRQQETVMFPEGMGMDVDRLERLYLNARILGTTCTALSYYGNGTVFYVER